MEDNIFEENARTAFNKYAFKISNVGVQTLIDTYKKFKNKSKDKVEQWRNYSLLCMARHGGYLSVIESNKMQYTAGFLWDYAGKRMFTYCTKDYTYDIPVPDDNRLINNLKL